MKAAPTRDGRVSATALRRGAVLVAGATVYAWLGWTAGAIDKRDVFIATGSYRIALGVIALIVVLVIAAVRRQRWLYLSAFPVGLSGLVVGWVLAPGDAYGPAVVEVWVPSHSIHAELHGECQTRFGTGAVIQVSAEGAAGGDRYWLIFDPIGPVRADDGQIAASPPGLHLYVDVAPSNRERPGSLAFNWEADEMFDWAPHELQGENLVTSQQNRSGEVVVTGPDARVEWTCGELTSY